MDKEHRSLLLGVMASGLIAPIISVFVAFLLNKLDKRG